jgi:uncharacterized protein YwqG
MTRDDAIALIRGSKLGDRLDRVVPNLRPAMRIRTTRAPAVGSALVSRFAGHGVLPRGVAWPSWDSSAFHRRWIEDGRAHMAQNKRGSRRYWSEWIERYEALVRDNPKPIDFLGMVRLADVSAHAGELGLPDRGALLFFYDVVRCQGSFWPEARGGWQVIYTADEADLVVVDEPPARSSELAPSTISFELQYSLPNDLRIETGDDDLHVHDDTEYERIHRILLGTSRGDRVIHQLRGAPQEVQHDLFHECQLASNGVDSGDPEHGNNPRIAELAEGAKDWQLLLQIDSDGEGPGWMWGDAGRLFFCIHRDDLTAGRFDRTWCVVQGH